MDLFRSAPYLESLVWVVRDIQWHIHCSVICPRWWWYWWLSQLTHSERIEQEGKDEPE